MGKDRADEDPRKILLVEDNPAIVKIMRKTLEAAGYQVLDAPDGRTAVALMAEKPDLILQDLILPDISGYDLVGKLRARSEDEKLPVLALSGFLARPEGPWDTSAGFDALLVKPVSNVELLETVRTFLSRGKTQS